MRPLTTMRLAATLLLLLPAGAFAAGNGAAAVQDCQDGSIDGTYTAAEYRQALTSIPTDVDEYTDCREVLRSAQLRAARTPTKPGGPPSSTPITQAPGSAAATPAASSKESPRGDESSGRVRIASGSAADADTPAAVAGLASALVPGTALPPRIPGLPVDGGAGAAGGAQDGSSLPTATASRATQEVPPTLAFLLVLTAGGLLAFGALRTRRLRRGAG